MNRLSPEAARLKKWIIFVSGEPHTPGYKYRMEMVATALTSVVPNGFDDPTNRGARSALEKWRMSASDGLTRLGYAGGTRTHQWDIANPAPAVARILREHPECRVVVFRKDSPDAARPCLALEKFPELAGPERQIECRLVAPLRRLSSER